MKNFIFFVVLLMICSGLHAVDIIVANGNNDGAGSFREAVEDLAVNGDQILFNVAQVVLQEPVTVDVDIIITGPVTINGANKTGLLDILGVDVDIDNVRFVNGNTQQGGGAIKAENGTTLSITNCQFINNKAVKAGGAIDLEQGANIDLLQDTLFQNNQSNLTGGAINIEVGGEITLIDNCNFVANKTLVSDPNNALPNFGGAIALEEDSASIVTIQDTRFQNNQTSGDGGAIANLAGDGGNDGIGDIIRCQFIANIAKARGGAIANLGVELVDGDSPTGFIANITDCDFTNNQAQQDSGGAVFNNGVIEVIERSLFFNNRSNFEGGGLFNDLSDENARDVNEINNCTFTNNFARRFGGGVFDKGGILAFDSCTIAFNNALIAGGGIAIDNNDSDVTLVNTIVAQNNAPTNRDVSGDNFNTGNNNLIGDGGNSNFENGVDGNIVGNAQNRINPLLGALANNGGETKTRAIAANSPARDAGDTDLDEDQRGFDRPDPINNIDDIGAFEFGAVEPVSGLVEADDIDRNTEEQFDRERSTDHVHFGFTKGAGVTVFWQEDDDEIIGFNVLRKVQDKEDFSKVNALLIMATPNKNYEFQDKDVSPGKRYFYRFQLISKNGDSKVTKPYKTTIPEDN